MTEPVFKDQKTKLNHALALASQGFQVFPLFPGRKTPAITKWQKNSTSDEATIKDWWSGTFRVTNNKGKTWVVPQDANIGIHTDGFVVIDVDVKDPKKNGMLSLKSFPPCKTRMSKTATGGYHIIFKSADKSISNMTDLRSGIDIRTKGGFIVAPGSVINGVEYLWVDKSRPIVDLTPELSSLITGGLVQSNNPNSDFGEVKNDYSTMPDNISPGNRDATLFSFACSWRERGFNKEQSLALMKELYTHVERSDENPFTWDEAAAKIDNAIEAYKPGDQVVDVINPQAKPSRKEITYLSGADVIAKPVEIEWLVANMMAMYESILIHAKGGVGKSMFVLYMILVLASYKKNNLNCLFQGADKDLFPIPKKRYSLVLGAENGRATTYQRLEKMRNGPANLKDGLKNIFFLSQYDDTTITGEVFMDESFCDFLVEFIKRIEQEQTVKIDLLIIDPLISFSGAKNENDSAEMRPALDAIDRVCKQVKCTPIVVHHDQKNGDDYRGATAINDWTRNRISMKAGSIAENKVTDVGSQGKPTGHIVVTIPAIRVTHEKCNNFQMFDSFMLKMTESLHFERVAEQLSPDDAEKINTVAQALSDMGGYAKSMNALAEAYCDLSDVSKNTAKKYIFKAVDSGLIRCEEKGTKGNNTYKFYIIDSN